MAVCQPCLAKLNRRIVYEQRIAAQRDALARASLRQQASLQRAALRLRLAQGGGGRLPHGRG